MSPNFSQRDDDLQADDRLEQDRARGSRNALRKAAAEAVLNACSELSTAW